MSTEDNKDWTQDELHYSALGDKRLDDRFKKLLKKLGDSPSANIPGSCDGWTETIAAYRFFQNERVTSESVLSSHRHRTIERISNNEVVLLVQDTTNLCYTTKKEKIKSLGYIDSPNDYGMLLHPTVAFTPEGLCLGVTTMQTVVRDVRNFGRGKAKSKSIPIEEKESTRWLEGYREASSIQQLAPQTQVVMVADRESDIYDIYEEASRCKADWIVRAKHDRTLKKGEICQERKLFAQIKRQVPIGTFEYRLPTRDKKKARNIIMEVRASTVVLSVPVDRKKEKLSPQTVNIVYIEEQNPPEGEKPVSWKLLTSLPVDTMLQARKVIEYYVARWHIECFFRVLKTGCEVEELQLHHYDHLAPCISLYLIITWRVMFLTHLGRLCPDLPCNAVFIDAEWKAAYIVAKNKVPPKVPPSLYEMIRIIASFGGYLNRQNDPPPGSQALWIGIQRTRDFTLGQMALLNIKIDCDTYV